MPSRSQSGRGILRKVSDAERGPIEVPVLAPHLRLHRIDDGQALLVSETFNTLLRGSLESGLLELLDGNRSREDVVGAQAGAHSASRVRMALAALEARGYVVSGDHRMERGAAAFWSSLGASPRWAEERLAASRVEIAGDGGDRLARKLADIGVAAGSDEPALFVFVCGDYLDERHARINRRRIESGAPWILVRPTGVQPLFGPVFRPAEQGPCWNCLAHRLRGHQEVHGFLRAVAGNDGAFRPGAAEPAVLDTVCGLVAAEIAKWLVLDEAAPVHAHALSLDLGRLSSDRHPVMRRPQCPECGDEALCRPDRPPVPVRLSSSPKSVSNSGGVRSVPPEETLARYGHLISPVSGVVTWLRRTSEEADPWLHVYWAGSNPALGASSLAALRRGLRSKSAGKGATPAQSRASALCEALERYSGVFHGDEIRRRRRFSDFLADGGDEAIHPNDVQLFSDRQLDDAAEINARGHPYNIVPPRFDPDAAMDWSPVWSLTRDRHRYLPTSMLYMAAEGEDRSRLFADSNGCAAGNTLEEAILQGFFELVERDAFAIWWYNGLRRPGVDLESFGDGYLAAAPGRYRDFGRDMWVLDVTGDLGIPVFVAVSRRNDAGEEEIIYGAGAHADPKIAALRAVCELNQVLNWVQGSRRGGAGHAVDFPMVRDWLQAGRIADHPHLEPVSGAPLVGASDHPVPETADARDDIERCRALVEARGMEFLALDQTRPDIGLPVARVIVPGMRHFWDRLAPGRLYDVPVEMGWRESPLDETGLNPGPVIA